MSGIPQLHGVPAQNRAKSGFKVTSAEATKNRVRREANGARGGFYIRFGKRIFDIIGAVLALVIAGPILLLCAAAVVMESRGPVFFRQWRVGQNGKPFQVFKLRTMIQGADKQGLKITAKGDPRITRVGRFLRKTKMDELPQLFNVLRDEMSLVGPRPEAPEYTLKYTLAERKVLDADKEHFYVSTIMRRKLQIDLAYCHEYSFLKDLKYVLLTGRALFMPAEFRAKSMKTTTRIAGETTGLGTRT